MDYSARSPLECNDNLRQNATQAILQRDKIIIFFKTILLNIQFNCNTIIEE